MENLFLHTCCAVCALAPNQFLLNKYPHINLKLWYYNPNIHPKKEYIKRRDCLAFYHLQQQKIEEKHFLLEISEEYNYLDFFKNIENNYAEPNRCRICYKMRMEKAAQEAVKQNYTAFSTTLLFSKRQKHNLIIEEAQLAAEKYNIKFYYHDWRPNWQEGHQLAKQYNLYKQNYCACIFSELER